MSFPCKQIEFSLKQNEFSLIAKKNLSMFHKKIQS